MFECALSTLNILGTGLLYTGVDPIAGGFNYPSEMPNYTVYKCKDDRYLAVASLERPFWEKFCTLIGRDDLQSRTAKPSDAALKETLAAEIEKKTLAQWTEIFDGSDCCVSPVNTLQEALSHQLTKEKGLLVNASHPLLGAIPQMITPVFNRNESEVVARDSTSHDARAVLADLGISGDEIDQLLDLHVIIGASEMAQSLKKS
jgi:crotonobetainyl-CoA:carnitine CoA-transferase CaiB-like acyl-CoA transferase